MEFEAGKKKEPEFSAKELEAEQDKMFGIVGGSREGSGSARRGATRSSMIETMSNESGRKSMTAKKPKKVF